MTNGQTTYLDGIPCMLMRGGTSKGAYFLASDLPSDRAEIDELMLRVMGSPDERQIDGLGGAHPLTSKVAIVSPSATPGIDVDYLFLQVGVDAATVSDSQTCGNLLAGVGPFAFERGLVQAGAGALARSGAEAGVEAGTGAEALADAAARPERTSVRINLVNTGDTAISTFETHDGRVVADGDTAIDGVPGTAAPIELELGGSDSAPLLPTGNVVDVIDGAQATLVNAGMPVVLLLATEFGVTGTESPAELESNTALVERVERIRREAGPLMGLGDVAEQSVPKMFLVSPPTGGGAITARGFIPHRVHTSIGVLMAASVAAGALIDGSVAAAVAVVPSDESDPVLIEHPSGTFETRLSVAQHPAHAWVVSSYVSTRTARKIFDGRVFPRPNL